MVYNKGREMLLSELITCWRLVESHRVCARGGFTQCLRFMISVCQDANHLQQEANCSNTDHDNLVFAHGHLRAFNRRDSPLGSSLDSGDLSSDKTSATGGCQSFVLPFFRPAGVSSACSPYPYTIIRFSPYGSRGTKIFYTLTFTVITTLSRLPASVSAAWIGTALWAARSASDWLS